MNEWLILGKRKYTTFLVYFCFVPIINLLQYSKYGISEQFFTQIENILYIVVPLISPVWVIMIFKEYYENEGNEIYFLYNNLKYVTIVKCLIMHTIILLMLFFIYSFLNSVFILEFVKFFVISFFMMGLSYFLMVISHSSALTWSAILIYVVYNIIFFDGHYNILCYYYFEWMSVELIIKVYLGMLIVSTIMVISGQIIALKSDSKRYT